jgi:ATP-dependent Zn protease
LIFYNPLCKILNYVLSESAKERAPCVIFIDEIDSVGGQRTHSAIHPYANQTINQLLSEMDGYKYLIIDIILI